MGLFDFFSGMNPFAQAASPPPVNPVMGETAPASPPTPGVMDTVKSKMAGLATNPMFLMGMSLLGQGPTQYKTNPFTQIGQSVSGGMQNFVKNNQVQTGLDLEKQKVANQTKSTNVDASFKQGTLQNATDKLAYDKWLETAKYDKDVAQMGFNNWMKTYQLGQGDRQIGQTDAQLNQGQQRIDNAYQDQTWRQNVQFPNEFGQRQQAQDFQQNVVNPQQYGLQLSREQREALVSEQARVKNQQVLDAQDRIKPYMAGFTQAMYTGNPADAQNWIADNAHIVGDLSVAHPELYNYMMQNQGDKLINVAIGNQTKQIPIKEAIPLYVAAMKGGEHNYDVYGNAQGQRMAVDPKNRNEVNTALQGGYIKNDKSDEDRMLDWAAKLDSVSRLQLDSPEKVAAEYQKSLTAAKLLNGGQSRHGQQSGQIQTQPAQSPGVQLNPQVQDRITKGRQMGYSDQQLATQLRQVGIDPTVYGLK